MNRKKILIITSSVLLVASLIYFVLVFTDIQRLKKWNVGTKPFICISEIVEENKETYKGIGYSVTYEDCKEVNEENDMVITKDYGDEIIIKFLGITVFSRWL